MDLQKLCDEIDRALPEMEYADIEYLKQHIADGQARLMKMKEWLERARSTKRYIAEDEF